MTPSDAPKRRKSWVPALILAVCVIPFVASYLVFYVWPPQSRMNYGALIEPHPLPSAPLARLDGSRFSLDELKGRWMMFQVDAGDCSQACERKLYYMRQVRLTQGRNMDRIERVWLISDERPVSTMLLREYDGTHFVRAGRATIAALPAERAPTDHIYLIDPLGNLMLRFPRDPDPSRMKKDLERLLKVSSKG